MSCQSALVNIETSFVDTTILLKIVGVVESGRVFKEGRVKYNILLAL